MAFQLLPVLSLLSVIIRHLQRFSRASVSHWLLVMADEIDEWPRSIAQATEN